MAMRVPRKTRLRGIAAVCAAAPLALASLAHAQNAPPNPGASAVSQYVEMVPTGAGPTASGIEKEKRTPLPRAGANALKQAPPTVAKPLEEIATSSTYGAPEPSEQGSQTAAREPDIVPPGASLEATLRSSAGAIGSASDTRLLSLLVAILVTTSAAVALAIRRASA